jgi:hypothetical protein
MTGAHSSPKRAAFVEDAMLQDCWDYSSLLEASDGSCVIFGKSGEVLFGSTAGIGELKWCRWVS